MRIEVEPSGVRRDSAYGNVECSRVARGFSSRYLDAHVEHSSIALILDVRVDLLFDFEGNAEKRGSG